MRFPFLSRTPAAPVKAGVEMSDLAAQVAHQAHFGQFRRDGITPYIKHPEKVASMCTSEEERAVAWLHDVLEDTKLTLIDLYILNIPRNILDAVVDLTKKDGQSYEEYLAIVKRNPLAKSVKIKDILCNLSDTPTEKQVRKYADALIYLLQ